MSGPFLLEYDQSKQSSRIALEILYDNDSNNSDDNGIENGNENKSNDSNINDNDDADDDEDNRNNNYIGKDSDKCNYNDGRMCDCHSIRLKMQIFLVI